MLYRHICVNVVDGVTIVRFHNVANDVQSVSVIDEIGNELRSLADEIRPCSLVLDFENVEFFTPAAFDAKLVQLQRTVTRRNGILRLCNLCPLVIQQLHLNRLASYLVLCDSLEAALTASIDQKPRHSNRSGDEH